MVFKKIIITVIGVFILFLMGTGIYENQSGILSSDGRKSILQDLNYMVTILSNGSAIVDEYREYKFLKGDFSRGYIEVEGFVDGVAVFEEDKPYKQLKAFDNNKPKVYFAVQQTGTNTRIEGNTRQDNYGMRCVFHKCGFAKEAHYRKAWAVQDRKPYDAIGYAITKEDWKNGKTTPVNWNDFKY